MWHFEWKTRDESTCLLQGQLQVMYDCERDLGTDCTSVLGHIFSTQQERERVSLGCIQILRAALTVQNPHQISLAGNQGISEFHISQVKL